MIAVNKIFEYKNGEMVECQNPLDPQFSGHTFTSNGINYRNILEEFHPDMFGKQWIFIYRLYIQDLVTGKWVPSEKHEIKADIKAYRDANGNLYIDSGDNEDLNNAFTYRSEPVYEEGTSLPIEYKRIKELKPGLTMHEFAQFWYGVLDSICRPELEKAIIEKQVYGITQITD